MVTKSKEGNRKGKSWTVEQRKAYSIKMKAVHAARKAERAAATTNLEPNVIEIPLSAVGSMPPVKKQHIKKTAINWVAPKSSPSEQKIALAREVVALLNKILFN